MVSAAALLPAFDYCSRPSRHGGHDEQGRVEQRPQEEHRREVYRTPPPVLETGGSLPVAMRPSVWRVAATASAPCVCETAPEHGRPERADGDGRAWTTRAPQSQSQSPAPSAQRPRSGRSVRPSVLGVDHLPPPVAACPSSTPSSVAAAQCLARCPARSQVPPSPPRGGGRRSEFPGPGPSSLSRPSLP